ncbi:putative secreted protein [Ophiocordyceps camponoti-floridani]|uniref:Putative secreted protein n=1 Tax=Ophiocordyceps camponoti-floridani TaxID=2030778 RepID=A0A8H4Q3D1_9HYPO|nr:putative secreted protein [Ophiocordyceps camponoti-floridani]
MSINSFFSALACVWLTCSPEPPSLAELRNPRVSVEEARAIVNNLEVHIGPTARYPAVITVTVRNSNPHAVVFIKDYSPLDPLALRLGMFNVTPAFYRAPLSLPRVRVRREWPPDVSALVSLQPGGTAFGSVNLHDLDMDFRPFGPMARVVLFGKWHAVWKGSLVGTEVFGLEGWGAMQGEFVSNSFKLNLRNV